MGRTILPFSQQVAYLEERLQLYRRGLRQRDQLFFDEIFSSALKQMQSGSLAAFPDPISGVLLSAFLEMRQKQAELEQELLYLKEKLAKIS